MNVRPAARVAALISLLVVVAYGASLGNEFVFDDSIFIERDERVQSLSGARRLFTEPLWGFDDPEGQRSNHQYYRPLQQLPLVISSVAFEREPWPAHALNLALHTLNATMLFALLIRIGARRDVAAVLATLFAVHPANSESVLWVADAAGLGMTACTLAALLVHSGRLGRWRSPVLMAPLSLAAMWFKENGILLPLLLLAHDATLGRSRQHRTGDGQRAAGDYAAIALATALYLVLRVRALGGLLPGADAIELGPAELAINAVALLPQYVSTLLWPFDLNMYHDFDAVTRPGDARFVGGAVVITAVAASIAVTFRRRPPTAFGLTWAAITVAPYLVARWPQLNVFAERYLYLPMIGLAIAVAGLTPAATSQRPRALRMAMGAALSLLVLGLVGVDRARTRDWADEVTIYTTTLEQSPRAELVRNNLALRYLALEQPLEGIRVQRELLRIDPDFPSGWHNMGLLQLASGNNAAALAAFEQARTHEPHNPATRLNLGYTYDLQGRREDAVASYFRAVAIAADEHKAWYNLAVIAFELGQLDNARRAAGRVLDLQSDDDGARVLLTRIDAAGSSAARRGPAATAATARRCNAARAHAEVGRQAEAVARLKTAAWLDERAPLPHHYLANVYYLAGRNAEALQHQRAALERAPDNELYARNLATLERLVSGDAGEQAGNLTHQR